MPVAFILSYRDTGVSYEALVVGATIEVSTKVGGKCYEDLSPPTSITEIKVKFPHSKAHSRSQRNVIEKFSK